MAVIHLDPWTDIVNVNWGGTITHVAFSIGCFSSTASEYLSLFDPTACFADEAASGSGNLSISATMQSLKIDVTLSGFYYVRRKTAPSTYTWHGSSSDKVGVANFRTVEGSLPAKREFSKFYENWAQAAVVGDLYSFRPYQAGDSGISTPTGGTFETTSNVGLRFRAPTISGTPGCVYDELAGTGERVVAADDVSLGTFAHEADVLQNVAVTYEGRPCTIIGAATSTSNGEYTNSYGATLVMNRPRSAVILASVNGAE
jgi:hypothetical protein